MDEKIKQHDVLSYIHHYLRYLNNFECDNENIKTLLTGHQFCVNPS